MANPLQFGAKEKSEIWIKKMLEYSHRPSAMSALKRSLSDRLAYRAMTYLASIGVAMDVNLSESEEAYQIIRYLSALFVRYHSGKEIKLSTRSFGKSMREMILKMHPDSNGKNDVILDDYSQKLKSLILISNKAKLCKKLASIILFMKNKEVHVDFKTLFVDIVYWNKNTQLSWATNYYKGDKDVSHKDNN